MPTKKAETELKRHTISLRLDDAAHALVSSEAWKRKTNRSQLIRQIALEQLRREGVKAETAQTA